MKIDQVMKPSPTTCRAGDNLAQVIEHMWDADCGIVPVVDENDRVLGVITDRDICIAAGTRDLSPTAIRVGDMVKGSLITCRSDDDVRTALGLMRQHRVRRLPVTTEDGILRGIVSLNDIALIAGPHDTATAAEVLATMNAIYTRSVPSSHASA